MRRVDKTKAISPSPGPGNSIAMIETGPTGQNARLVCNYIYELTTIHMVNGHPTSILLGAKVVGLQLTGSFYHERLTTTQIVYHLVLSTRHAINAAYNI